MKKEIIILLAVVVALSTYLIVRNTDGTHYTLPELTSVAPKEVDRMEIKTTDSTLTLEKQGEGWTLAPQGFPVKEKAVSERLNGAVELALTALVSETESYNRYGLDQAKTLTLFQGQTPLRVFTVGKTAPSRRHTFVTVGTDKNVYQAQGDLSTLFSTKAEDYIDKTIFSFTTANVTSLTITQREKSIVLTRAAQPANDVGDPSPWKNVFGNTVEKKEIDPLLATLGALNCDTWQEKKTEGASPSLVFIITTDRPYTLSLFEGVPMTGAATDKNFAFSLSEATGNTLAQNAETLLTHPQPKMVLKK